MIDRHFRTIHIIRITPLLTVKSIIVDTKFTRWGKEFWIELVEDKQHLHKGERFIIKPKDIESSFMQEYIPE
jgi:hypothetical protein